MATCLFLACEWAGALVEEAKYGMSTQPINQPTPEIAAWHKRWDKNSAFVAGSEAVKALGERLLPKVRADDGPKHYKRHLMNTSCYPAAAAIATGMQALIERKPAKLDTDSARVELLAKSLTYRNHSYIELGRRFLREKIKTNYNGLLADHPSKEGFTGLNADNADRKGYRPRVSLYVAKSILEVTEGPVGLDHKLINVRLLENDGQRVRHLFINDEGIYQQRVYNANGSGSFDETQFEMITPTINGVPMTEIPFVLDTSEGGTCPSPAIIERAVDLNHEHYLLSGMLSNMTWQTSGPIVFLPGFTRELDENGEEIEPDWDFGPNGVIELKDGVKPEYFTFDPKNSELITSQLDKLEAKLSTLNHSIIAAEKAAPEAPDTLLLRRVAENATLAGFTAGATESMNKVLNFWSKWVDGSEVTFSFNTDFTPAGITPAQHKEIREDFLTGLTPHDMALQALVEGEVYPPTTDIEVIVERARAEKADLPPTGI